MELFKLLGTIAVDNSEANKALKDTTSNAKDTAKALDDTSSSGEESGGKLGTALSKIGSGALAVGKAVGTGMVIAGTAIAGLATKAIQSYADYEQLVGGVETLFKGSAGVVQEYAENAYKTAGLSANEYMDTVTSFAASLIQSLGGDTAAASEQANMAITDMSDNANKMGTSMTMIQNAYQGFAKQNFTMLDNLKLGYGGTQEEMDRLLQDAEKLAGLELGTFDRNNFSDVVNAIHIIQTEMGITGTTAKEASSTISGSIASMKSSWQNLLTAISSDDLPFEDYVANFVESVSTVADNLMPRIQIALNGVVQLIDQLAPVIIGKIPELLSTLLPSIVETATQLVQSIVAVIPQIISALIDAVPALIQGLTQIINSLIEALPSLIQVIVSALPSLLPALIDGIVSMIVTLCNNFAQIIQPIIDYLPAIIISIVGALMNNLPALISGVITLVMGIVAALPQIIQALVDAIPIIVEMIVTALLENLPALIMGCIQVVLGLCQALPQIWASLAEALPNVFKGIWEAVKKVFAPAASWFDTNVIQPVAAFFTGLWEKMKEIWDGICNAVKIAFQLIGSIISAAFNIITLPFQFIWENCKEYVFAAWEWIKEKVSAAINAVKDVISKVWNAIKSFLEPILDGIKNTFNTVWNAIKNAVSTAVNAIKDTVSKVFNAVKSTVSSIWDGVKSKITDVVNSIKNTISKVFGAVKTTVGDIFESIKEKMSTPIEKARDTIKGIVDKIKGFFSGMNISFPHIKLPHFSITPSGWKIGDLLKGSIPKLGIEWYAKAMNNPMLMTQPTVFGYNSATGQLMGGGEKGGEVVSGANTLMNMIGSAVESKTGEQTERIIAVLTAVLEAILSGNRELLEAVLAGHVIKLNDREVARTVRTYA